MNSVSRLFQEVPDFGEVVFYAILVAVMVIAVVIGRLLIRSMVSSRVKSIHTEGLDLGDLSDMGKKGLLTDEELKLIRRRYAERQLEETKEKESGLKARDLLLAIESDPSRATSLLPPSSEHAKKALEGLKKGTPKSVEDQLRAQLGEGGPSGPSMPAPAPRPRVERAQSEKAAPRAAPETPKAGRSRSEPEPPRAAPTAEPTTASEEPKPKAAGAPSGGMDLDAMLAQGLISKREYDLLMSRIKKSGG